MIIKLRPNAAFTLFLLFIAAFFLFHALNLHYRAKLVPLIILIPMILLCLFQLSMDLFPRIRTMYESAIESDLFKDYSQIKGDSQELARPSKTVTRLKEWKIFGWLGCLLLAIYLLGFELGISIFLLLFFWLNAVNWIKSLATTALTWVFIHYLFVWYLHTPFPKGLLLSLVYMGGH